MHTIISIEEFRYGVNTPYIQLAARRQEGSQKLEAAGHPFTTPESSLIGAFASGGMGMLGRDGMPHQGNLRRVEGIGLVDEIAEGALQGSGFGGEGAVQGYLNRPLGIATGRSGGLQTVQNTRCADNLEARGCGRRPDCRGKGS